MQYAGMVLQFERERGYDGRTRSDSAVAGPVSTTLEARSEAANHLLVDSEE